MVFIINIIKDVVIKLEFCFHIKFKWELSKLIIYFNFNIFNAFFINKFTFYIIKHFNKVHHQN